jgi:cellulose biosynthesis protein BcsQ
MCSCFGYALLHGGQRVLMIDGDPATDGLSLFLLGPKGQDQVSSFEEQSTFIGALERFQKTGSSTFEPRSIHRRSEDHGVTYSAIISGRGLYGDGTLNLPAVPDLNQSVFRAGIRHMFDQLRQSGEYDYVLVDTRGGFAFESTDLCALADSYIVVTEPDYTSFYQDRNLVSRVSAAARDVESPSLLRAMIVNKAVDAFPNPRAPYLDTLEVLFRDQLVKEFPVRFKDTHPVPVSIEALMAYKAQKIPYKSAPESAFCMATLSAFSDILGTVTSKWTEAEVDQWNVLVDTVSRAVKQKTQSEAAEEQARRAKEQEFESMRTAVAGAEAKLATIQREHELKVTSLEREIKQRDQLYEREYARSEALIGNAIAQVTSGNTGTLMMAPDAEATWSGSQTPPQASGRIKTASIARPVAVPLSASLNSDADGSSTPAITSTGRLTLLKILAVIAISLLVILGLYLLLRPPVRVRSIESPAMGNDTQGQVGAITPSQTATTAPGSTATPDIPADPTIVGSYAVVLAAGKALAPEKESGPSATYEAQMAIQDGYRNIAIYQRNRRYTALTLFDNKDQAVEAMKKLQKLHSGRWASTASIVTMSDWCPVKTADKSVVIVNTDVPVWSCISLSTRVEEP